MSKQPGSRMKLPMQLALLAKPGPSAAVIAAEVVIGG
jgi:hypothetical protein